MSKNLLQYAALISIALVLALVAPMLGKSIFPYGKIWLFGLFFLSVIKVKTADITKLERKTPFVVAIALLRLILVPIVVFVLSGEILPTYQLPLTLMALAPVGETAALFTEMLGGTVSTTVALATLTGIAAPLWIPCFFQIFMGQQLSLPIGDLMKDLVIVLIIPLLLGIGFQFKLPKITSNILKIQKPLSLGFLLLILTGSFASQIEKILALPFLTIIATALIIVGFLFSLGLLGVSCSLYADKKDQIASVTSFLLMNYTLALFIGSKYFTSQPLVVLTIVMAIIPWNISYIVYGAILDQVGKKR